MATIDKYKLEIDVQGQQAVDKLKNSLGGLGATIAGIGFGAFVAGAFKMADAIGDIADATGIAVGQIVALSDSLKSAGGDAKDVGKILTSFYGNLEQAASGSEKAQDALGKVGIKLGDLTKLSEGQLLSKALTSLAEMDAGAQRTAAGIEIFGKAFRNIDPKKLQEILDTKDVTKFEQEFKKAADVVDNLEQNFSTLQKATLNVLTPLIGEVDNFKLSLQQAETIIKTIGIIMATVFAAKVVTTIVEIVTVMKSLNAALKTNAIIQAGIAGLQGPKGWAIMAGGAIATTAAILALNKALEETENKEVPGVSPTTAPTTPTTKPAFSETSLYSKEELRARQQALTTAQQITQQQQKQNQAAQDYQRIINSTIGLEQDQADLIKLNAQLEQDANNKILDLNKQIQIEKSKGRGTNQAVIQELEKQKQEVKNNLEITKQLKQEELDRLNVLKSMASYAKLASQENTYVSEIKALTEKVKLVGLVGDELERETKIQQLREEFDKKHTEYINKKLQLGTNATAVAKQEIEDEWNAYKKYYDDRTTLEGQLYQKQKALRNDSTAGAKSALESITRSFDPFTVAQNKVNSIFSNMNSAIDNFVDNGKLSFRDLATSVLKDLAKIELKALFTKSLTGAFGSGGFLSSLLGFADGGSPPVGVPSIVGEKGPELFVPKAAGTIIPNNKLKTVGTSTGAVNAPVTNNYITNNISAVDAKSVAQLFAENRKTLFGTVKMAEKEMSYGR